MDSSRHRLLKDAPMMAAPEAAAQPPAPSATAIWAALAPAASAKGVKDVLKERGWLDQNLKVGSAKLFSGRIAFPLLAEAVHPSVEVILTLCARRGCVLG